MSKTKIEWTEVSWNPLTGCTKISPGCANCYAERMAKRLHSMGNENYANGFKLTLHEHMLMQPIFLKKPSMVFVNSMSDLFHADVPLDFIKKVFKTMQSAKQHTFQLLTKRSSRLKELAPELPWPKNVWVGVSVENADYLYRIANLAAVPAHLRFVSAEPLLGPLPYIPLSALDWVIVGGESGPGARPMQEDWVRDIRDQCVAAGKPFFFKQWGGVSKKKAGRTLDGREWSQYPSIK